MIRRNAEEWQHLIDTQQASDMTVEEFCLAHQINQSTFYLQRKKLSEMALTQGNSQSLPIDAVMP